MAVGIADSADAEGESLLESYCLPLDTGCGSAAARVFARRCLNRWGLGDVTPFGQDAVLVVSELVTNAILHADVPEELRLSWRAPTLVVEVQDVGEEMPEVRRALDTEPGSRGLEIVSQLAYRWQVRPAPAGRKTVRAELRRLG
ncbi:hypothetical protein AQ490_10455 [Wenjunlia vitaminophila]|uniref:Histidine kinase/HSP90-like ATPase domain-containing protein n=1 Tax=Wenjunlia vitaminophila TaxID=76728 RepID=A0A0T6LM40_WENVI|nr:ATP-binding protein [Wenjunlia vitaminophila]KRV47150.1 hypothetical protein AQ490_10455 [Wenjunlia vitaminophila]